jgi:hypothetical protein
MYTYNTTYYTTTSVDTEALGAAMGVASVFALILMVIMIVANWKIFTKAGKPGWQASCRSTTCTPCSRSPG